MLAMCHNEKVTSMHAMCHIVEVTSMYRLYRWRPILGALINRFLHPDISVVWYSQGCNMLHAIH